MSPQYSNFPIFPLKATETSLNSKRWANGAPCLWASTNMNFTNHFCPFAKAIREHTNGFYRMQMQPLRTPSHVSQGWMPAGRHDVPKGAAWGGNLLWKSHYRALSRRGRKPPLIAAAHPAPAGKKLLCSWWERDLLWQPDSRVKPPRC